MLDIGLIHRKEYELETGRSGGTAAGKRADSAANSGKSSASKGELVTIAQAPGRIHLLGDHGDPGANLYLSAAIDRCIMVAVSPRKDNSLRFYAADFGERKRATLINLKYKREDRWANYIKTAIHVFVELGCQVRGMNFTVAGNIPQQVGLASSSAIEVASAVALRGFFRCKINDQELALKLAAAHALFFDKKANLADYIIGLSARSDQFLVVDEADQSLVKIKSPFLRCKIVLVDSRVPRLGINDELETRRQDVKTALDMLSQNREGASFRDFAAMDLMESMGDLPEEIRRRSLHIVQEIRRVSDARDFLIRADLGNFSRLVYHSHESLRDLYEVSCPEIDWMVKRAQETAGVLGARMTGQGFGGCTFAIVRNEVIGEYRSRIEDYERIFGFHPVIYEVKIATGAKIVNT